MLAIGNCTSVLHIVLSVFLHWHKSCLDGLFTYYCASLTLFGSFYPALFCCQFPCVQGARYALLFLPPHPEEISCNDHLQPLILIHMPQTPLINGETMP